MLQKVLDECCVVNDTYSSKIKTNVDIDIVFCTTGYRCTERLNYKSSLVQITQIEISL